MSKAFTRESDELQEAPVIVRLPSALLPSGAKNYLTEDGADRLRKELEHLIDIERPRLSNMPEIHDMKGQLQALDQRIMDLRHSLQTAIVVPVPQEPLERVRFGSSVTVQESNGDAFTYRIVGVDETDLDRNWVSYLSPLARALMNGRVGDQVKFKSPAGERELKILKIGRFTG